MKLNKLFSWFYSFVSPIFEFSSWKIYVATIWFRIHMKVKWSTSCPIDLDLEKENAPNSCCNSFHTTSSRWKSCSNATPKLCITHREYESIFLLSLLTLFSFFDFFFLFFLPPYFFPFLHFHIVRKNRLGIISSVYDSNTNSSMWPV